MALPERRDRFASTLNPPVMDLPQSRLLLLAVVVDDDDDDDDDEDAADDAAAAVAAAAAAADTADVGTAAGVAVAAAANAAAAAAAAAAAFGIVDEGVIADDTAVGTTAGADEVDHAEAGCCEQGDDESDGPVWSAEGELPGPPDPNPDPHPDPDPDPDIKAGEVEVIKAVTRALSVEVAVLMSEVGTSGDAGNRCNDDS